MRPPTSVRPKSIILLTHIFLSVTVILSELKTDQYMSCLTSDHL